MPEGRNNKAGDWETDYTRHAWHWYRVMHDPRTKKLTIVSPAQNAKTASGINIVLARLDDDPVNTIMVAPTKRDCEKKLEPDISEAINNCPSLSRKLARGQKDTKTEKIINGIPLWLAWGGSSRELSGKSAGLVWITDRDQMDPIPGHGSIDRLAKARGRAFTDFKYGADSTPTLGNIETFVHEETGLRHWAVASPDDVHSPIWRDWQMGSREEMAVPCPHCGDYFIPRSGNLSWPGKDTDDECTPDEALQSAFLICENGCPIEAFDDAHGDVRQWMYERHVFVGPGQRVENGQAVGDLVSVAHRSAWNSGLFAPMLDDGWGECAYDLITARRSGDPAEVQGVMNTVFGECYTFKGDAPDWQVIKDKAEGSGYSLGTVPDGVQLVFLTVDVQGDRLVCVVRGWGYALESWLLEYAELMGDTTEEFVWERLTKLLNREFGDLRISAATVDGKYNKDQVHKWARQHRDRVRVIVGASGKKTKPYSSTVIDVDSQGRPKKFGLRRWSLDSVLFKKSVHARCVWPDDQEGAWHLYAETPEQYCKELVAESCVVLADGSEAFRQTSRDNHVLDCEYAQFFLADIERVRDLAPIEETPETDDLLEPIVL